MIIVGFLSMFSKVIFNWIAKFIRWLIIGKVPLLSLSSNLKVIQKTNSNQYNDDKYKVKYWCVQNEAISPLWIICIFKISSYQNILINFDLFPNNNGYFVAYVY